MSLRAGRSGIKKSDVNPITGESKGGAMFELLWENEAPTTQRLPIPFQWDFDCSKYTTLMIETTVQYNYPMEYSIQFIGANDGPWITSALGGSNRKYAITDGVLSTNDNSNNLPMRIWGAKLY